MFGYKLEIWKYESFNYDKAQEHILAMAEKGYELTDISTYWIPLAGYRKTENTSRRKYCVVLIPADDENFMQLCEDSGWHLLAGQKDGLTVLYSENPEARPIFTEEESEAIMAQDIVSEKQVGIGCAYIFLIPFMLGLTWMAVKLCYIPKALPLVIFCILMWLLIILDFISVALENRALKEQIRLVREGDSYEKPEWLYKFYSFKAGISIIGFLGVLGIHIWAFMLHIEIQMVLLIITAVLVIFTSGVFVKVFLQKKRLGQILMALAAFILYLVLQLLKDL